MENIINKAFETKEINEEVRQAVLETIKMLDSGKIRICEKINDKWTVNEYAKKAVLLSFKINNNTLIESGQENLEFGKSFWFDKVASKFSNWTEEDFKNSGLRAVPGCFVRKGCYIAKSVVIMPSFINIGAFVDEGTMIDSFVTVGSCAQVGKKCHISSNVVIAGVLEPLQANPVIIEDNCFVGAGSLIAEGSIIGEGSILGAGTHITSSTKIIDRETGAVSYGKVPPYSVVVPGVKTDENGIGTQCAIIIKKVSKETKEKTSLNDLLRP